MVPGKYKVSLSKFADGKFTELVPPQEFVCKPLNHSKVPLQERLALDKFNKKVASLAVAISGADAYATSLTDKLSYIKKAFFSGSHVPATVYDSIVSVEKDLKAFNRKLSGDALIA